MKILLHSHAAWPKVGGLENVTDALARGWAARGHDVVVVTETPLGKEAERDLAYRVVRNPSIAERYRLVAWADVVHANGASLRYVALAWLLRRPFSWTHGTYGVACVDGLGWVDGEPAPMTPWRSIGYHRRRFGARAAGTAAAKLLVRRAVARRVDANVAVTRHVAERQPLPRQVVIYNPFDPRSFRGARPSGEARDAADGCTFTFLGRLVSEKGVDDLLHALRLVSDDARARGAALPTLKVIGDGPQRGALTALAETLGVAAQVRWAGSRTGAALAAEVASAGICVLPSAWEEPMGIVVLELLTAEKPLIVSARGGMSECAGDACITFPNRDRAALARAMTTLASDVDLQARLVANARRRVAELAPEAAVDAYLGLFDRLVGRGDRRAARDVGAARAS